MAEAIGIARDWALILLAVEGLVLSVIPLYLYLKATKGLRKLLIVARPFLRRVRVVVARGERVVYRGSNMVSRPFIAAQAVSEGLRAFGQACRARRD